MFTTGSKLFFGYATLALGAALVFALGSQGESWLFAVFLLVSLAAATAFLGVIVVTFRDGDAGTVAVEAVSAADAEGTTDVGAGVAPSVWPLVVAFGLGLIAVGLVTDSRYFVGGIIVLVAAIIEWMVTAWADRASADPDYNRSLRARFMHPIEFPLTGLLIAGLVIYGFSRVMLAISRNGSFIAFTGIGVLVLGAGTLVALRPRLGRRVVGGILALGAAGILVAGAVAAVKGERNFDEQRAEAAPNAVSDSANTFATLTLTDGGFNVNALQVGKAATANILVRNNASQPATFVVDGRYKDATGASKGTVFSTKPIKPGKTGLLTIRLTRSGTYPYTAQFEDGSSVSGTLTVP
jgi:hypothetical protein